MTTVTSRPEGPSRGGAMPAWGIVANLIPPELVESRWVAVLQRRIALGLALTAVLCAAGYAYAVVQVRSATDEAQAANERTVYLNRSADKYVGITQIETTVTGLDSQLATVMANDVDVAGVVASIRRDLPTSMSMETISLTLSSESTTEDTAMLDRSGRPTIGTVTISGSGKGLDDLPSFVDGLSAVRGFANVLPTSNLVSDGISQFSVAFTLTDQLYTRRYNGAQGASR